MNRIFATVPFALAPLVLSACLAGQRPTARPVQPGHLFAGELLNIRAPNTEGWQLVNYNAYGIGFAKNGTEVNESYAAQVLRFSPPAFQKPEEFLSYVRDGVAKDTSPEHFDILSSDSKQSTVRPYPCVSVEYTARDKKARISRTGTEPLLLQAISLYCKRSTDSNIGFAIIFSHRGSKIDQSLRQSAEDFIKGVDLAGK